MKHLFARTLAIIALATMMASASAEQLCVGQQVPPGPDGRVLGHLPYGQASAAELVYAPPAFAIGPPCRLRPEAAADLVRLLHAAALTPGLAGRIRAVSCYRTIDHQRAVFCGQIGPGKRCRDAAERARAVGPPGYSEHATGYAIDFGTRPSPGCGDVDACFARTPAGLWLIAHAAEFGFELSFPAGNAQGVTWEPWHWRWVGTASTIPGAGPARAIFARARAEFQALPMVPNDPAEIATPPLLSVPTLPTMATPASSGQGQRLPVQPAQTIAPPAAKMPAAAPAKPTPPL